MAPIQYMSYIGSQSAKIAPGNKPQVKNLSMFTFPITKFTLCCGSALGGPTLKARERLLSVPFPARPIQLLITVAAEPAFALIDRVSEALTANKRIAFVFARVPICEPSIVLSAQLFVLTFKLLALQPSEVVIKM